jgi:hypothetical protein
MGRRKEAKRGRSGPCHGGGELVTGQRSWRSWHAQGRPAEGRRAAGRCGGDAWRRGEAGGGTGGAAAAAQRRQGVFCAGGREEQRVPEEEEERKGVRGISLKFSKISGTLL